MGVIGSNPGGELAALATIGPLGAAGVRCDDPPLGSGTPVGSSIDVARGRQWIDANR